MRVKRLFIAVTTLFFLFSLVSFVSAGNPESANMTVYVLNSPPAIANISIAPGLAEPGDTLFFTVNVTDLNGVPQDINITLGFINHVNETVYLTYNTTTLLYENLSYALPPGGIPYGVYTFFVNVTDYPGALAESSATFLVGDWTLPIINYTNATPHTIDPGDQINITANVTDNVVGGVDTVLVEFNGANYTMTYLTGDIWNYTALDTNLDAGTYNYTILANDTYGNWAVPLKGNFTVNQLIRISLRNYPIDFGNSTVNVTDRRADDGNAQTGNYSGVTIKGFPLKINNTGNVDLDLSISGQDLMGQSDSNFNISALAVSYDTDNTISGAAGLTYTSEQFAGNVVRDTESELFFWINITQGIPSQHYQGNVTITAQASS